MTDRLDEILTRSMSLEFDYSGAAVPVIKRVLNVSSKL